MLNGPSHAETRQPHGAGSARSPGQVDRHRSRRGLRQSRLPPGPDPACQPARHPGLRRPQWSHCSPATPDIPRQSMQRVASTRTNACALNEVLMYPCTSPHLVPAEALCEVSLWMGQWLCPDQAPGGASPEVSDRGKRTTDLKVIEPERPGQALRFPGAIRPSTPLTCASTPAREQPTQPVCWCRKRATPWASGKAETLMFGEILRG